jgi:hypothetical protein
MQDCLAIVGDGRRASAQSRSQSRIISAKDKMNVCKNLADKKNLTGNDRMSFLKDCMNKANPK